MARVLYTAGLALMAVAGFAMQPAFADTPSEVLATIQKKAAETPNFKGFSATQGEVFFKSEHGGERSCTSCHTPNPATIGKYIKTGKAIDPLAPSANAERFTDFVKVEKWFKRNCNDVLSRECTAQEKGDVLTYLLTIGK